MTDASPDPSDEDKLIAELPLSADAQIIGLGLIVFAFLAGGALYSTWFDGDEEPLKIIGAESLQVAIDSGTEQIALPTVTLNEGASGTTSAASLLETHPGDITITETSDGVVLSGYVGTQTESEIAARTVHDSEFTLSRNDLVILEPKVADVVISEPVVNSRWMLTGTKLHLSGSVPNQTSFDSLASKLDEIEGLSHIDNRVKIDVSESLNELPQVQFSPGSAGILTASHGDLNAAAELITQSDATGIEIKGYTDTQGVELANQRLSEARANAVRSYLVNQGVDGNKLVAIGLGETEQFASGNAPEALAANRKVIFSIAENPSE